jgi:hypothetical protein
MASAAAMNVRRRDLRRDAARRAERPLLSPFSRTAVVASRGGRGAAAAGVVGASLAADARRDGRGPDAARRGSPGGGWGRREA